VFASQFAEIAGWSFNLAKEATCQGGRLSGVKPGVRESLSEGPALLQKEITENLQPWRKVEFRPDLVARVFRIKLKELLHDITHNHVLGVDVAKIHVIEFQRRGLPHAHILVILREEEKPRTKELIDKMVSAEIPLPETHPRLHELVKKHMIHGPCGVANPTCPCMQDGVCTKKFPKLYISETNPNVNGFSLYQRRNTGLKYYVGTNKINNTWVMPYNPY
jgi:hypothetical protein